MKDTKFTFKLSTEEKKKIEENAREDGMKISEYIRQKCIYNKNKK